MFEYLTAKLPLGPAIKPAADGRRPAGAGRRRTAIDRTAKLFIGGKQVRPDGNYSLAGRHRQGQAGRRGRARQPQGHPRRRRGRARLQGLAAKRPPTTAARCSTISPRTFRPRRRVRRPPDRADRRQRQSARAKRSTQSIERLFLLCRPGRQVRGPRPPAAGPRRHAGAATSRSASIGIVAPDEAPLLGADLAGGAGAGHGQHGRRSALRAPSVLATDLYQVIEYFRRSRRRDQHRHRPGGRACRGACQA